MLTLNDGYPQTPTRFGIKHVKREDIKHPSSMYLSITAVKDASALFH